VHATVRARAAQAGESLSDYILREIERLAARPAIADVLLRAQSRTGSVTVDDIVDAVRAGREERD
jgi:antitoxin FitA